MRKILKLYFKTPLHIGAGGFGLEHTQSHIPSDVLSGAVMSTAYWAGKQNIVGKYLCSSAFPFVDDILFFPKPGFPIDNNEDFSNQPQKIHQLTKLKKSIPYLSKPTFESWITCNPDGVTLETLQKDEELIKQNFKVNLRPRIVMDRINNSADIYYFSEIFVNKGAGFWAFFDFPEEIEEALTGVIKLLGDIGLGGDRSTGCGRFNIKWAEVPQIKSGKGKYMTLSCSIPRQDEVSALESYKLIQRGGWAYQRNNNKQVKLPPITMIAEGALLKKCIQGELKTLEINSTKIYRDGRAWQLEVSF